MNVEVSVPAEFQGTTIGGLNRRKGYIKNTETVEGYTVVDCEVPLNAMFGYSTDLRTATQGKGEFSMEYLHHKPVTRDQRDHLMKEYQKERTGQDS